MNDNHIEKSTRLLRKEHQRIESAIIAIAELIKELENGVALNRRRMWGIAHAFATYVGRWHHSKEDFLLSMIRTRRGCSADYPVRSFYEEHHLVELLIARLRKTADEYAASDHSSENFIQSLRDVVDFYPGHMWKADHILFPLADEVLSEPDQTVLVRQFAWIDSAIGTDADEQLRAIVAEFRPQTRVA
jgi:hemerythrin-like domain-containing protein